MHVSVTITDKMSPICGNSWQSARIHIKG